MTIVFVSNYFNHHQKPFCEEMYKKLNGNFVFIATSAMRKERILLGYKQEDQPAYVHLAHQGEAEMKKALDLINQADVVIVGSAPNQMVLQRIRENKLVFRYSERPYKKQVSFIKRFYHFFRWHQNDLWKKNVYLLCAGAYVLSDYASVGMYKNRAFKWGYFPHANKYDIIHLLSEKKPNTLLWCGRFIDWKHPDDAIRVAKRLKDDGYDFHLNMIGAGVMESELKQLVNDYSLNNDVTFHGSMSPDDVRLYMEQSSIFLFTSDRCEGWGAVLNESMNSACAVVASHAIGSVPFLIKNEKNGLVYESGNTDMLYKSIKRLFDHPELQTAFGKEAYKTIADQWNAKIAADRLLVLISRLNSNEDYAFQDGPCSCAHILKEE